MNSHTFKDNILPENIEIFELELTKDQLHALSTMLPRGFSLELVPKSTTIQSSGSKPSKKLFTNEGTQVVRKNSKPAEVAREDILINKQALRDPGKRKFPGHHDYKYPNVEITPSTSSKPIKINNETVRKCHILLQKLKRHSAASPFLHPVDVVGLGLLDYFEVVKEPMDLSTAENKLKGAKYLTLDQFLADIRKIWNNAILYNMKGSHIYLMTMEMSGYFEKLVRDFENVGGVTDTVKDLEKKVEMLSKQITQMSQKGRSSSLGDSGLKLNRSGSKTNKNAKLMDKPLTLQEKKEIVQNIQKLPPEHLRGVWEIVSKETDSSGREELEFDIERLPIHVARELERYIKNKLSLVNRGKNKGKAKDAAMPKETQSTSYSGMKHHEEFEPIGHGEDELTTQHHSIMGSVEKPEPKEVAKKGASPASSESSFISDSDIDDDEKANERTSVKGSSSLQKQQEIANFFAGGHGSMLNSFIVK